MMMMKSGKMMIGIKNNIYQVKYLKLFEIFITDIELSDKTIDDVLKPDFFEEEIEDEGSTIDSNGVIHIKNWNIY